MEDDDMVGDGGGREGRREKERRENEPDWGAWTDNFSDLFGEVPGPFLQRSYLGHKGGLEREDQMHRNEFFYGEFISGNDTFHVLTGNVFRKC